MTTIMNLLEKLDRESDVVDELRHHLELVLEGFLAGPLDTAPVSKIVADAGYEQVVDEFRPKLNEAFVSFLSALLYALKTSLIDVELIDHRAYDLSEAHERLKNLVNSLKSAVDLWLRKLPEEPKLVAREEPADRASLTYENALAMSCINKVLISSLSKSDKSVVPEIKLAGGDYSYESSTTLTVFCDGDRNEWPSAKVELHKKSTDGVHDDDRLKKFCAGAGGGVPFPEFGVDIVDCEWWAAENGERVKELGVAGHQSPAAVPMTSTEWEDNWLFRRKAAGRVEAFNLEPVQMVIPKPKDPATGVTLGSLDIDALSELSENNSVASLDFSSTESESDRPQVTGAVMKPLPQDKTAVGGHIQGKVTVSSEQATVPTISTRQTGTTIVTVNGSTDHSIIIETLKQTSDNHTSSTKETQQIDKVTHVSGKPPVAPSASRRDPDKPLMGPRAKATFDGKVVMENIEEIKAKSIQQGVAKATGDGDIADVERRTPQGRSSVAYDELSIRAFQEETLQSLEERLEFRERIDTTGTTNSLRSLSEEELDVHTSVSTDFSFRRSPEGCSSSAEPQSQTNTPNLTRMFIGKSSSNTETLVQTTKQPTEKRSSLLREQQQQELQKQHNVIISDNQHLSRQHNHRSSVDSGGVVDVPDAALPSQKIRASRQSANEAMTTATTESEHITVSASISSGRGSTASTDSASSVQSYDLAHRESASASRLSETSLDQDRSISAEPSCQEHHDTLGIVQQSHSTEHQATESHCDRSLIATKERVVESLVGGTLALGESLEEVVAAADDDVRRSSSTARSGNSRDGSDRAAKILVKSPVVVAERAAEAGGGEHLEPIDNDPELDRDQDIYCVLPTSRLEVDRSMVRCSAETSTIIRSQASVGRRKSMSIDGDVERRVQRFQSSTLPNPKRRGGGSSAVEKADRVSTAAAAAAVPVPAKRNLLLKLNSSQRVVDIFAPAAGSSTPSSSIVETIPVPKNRRSFTQVFPRPVLPPSVQGSAVAAPETIAERADLPGIVQLKTVRGTFGVQVYPAPAPQPRPRRSPGGAEATSGTSSGRTLSQAEPAPQDVDITPMKKTVIEQDLQDKLPSVKRLASRFREPVRPGDFHSATLPTPARRRKENARKKDDDVIARRLSQFDSYT